MFPSFRLHPFQSRLPNSALPQTYVPHVRERLLWNLTRRYSGQTLVTIAMGFSGALFNGISTILIVPVILSILDQPIDPQRIPPLLQFLLSPFATIPVPYRLGVMTASIILALGLKNLTSYINTLMGGTLKRSLTADLRQQSLQMLLTVDLDFYHKTGVGDILNRVNAEVGRTTGALQCLIRMMSLGMTIVVFIYLLIGISPKLTLAATALLSMVVLINQAYIRRAKGFGKRLSALSRRYSTRLTETLTGIRLIKETVSEQREYQTLTTLIQQRETLDFQVQANSAAIAPISEMVGIMAIIVIVFLGRIFFGDQLNAVSAILLTYLVVLFKLLPIVSQLNSARSQFANFSASVDVVKQLLRRDDKPFMHNGTRMFEGFQEAIAFDQVSFAYPDASNLALKTICLTLPKGQTLALVGTSGAGKSTLADLLPRFYDPLSGRITIDGRDLREFETHSLRSAMGIVSQEAFLFNDTVRNNIAYARPDATESDIIEALKQANAYEFIMDLPQGLDTPIGDRGVLLSGGQRQRLAIARALLKNASILILDEATSALDTASERLVQEAIDQLSRDRTTLIIAHRLSTIQNADQIAVMRQGEVVELGTHDELLAHDGYYSQLYALQFSRQADENAQVHANLLFKEALSSASHTIRDRLNSIIGSLSMVADDLVDSPEEKQEMLTESYESATRLLHWLENLERNH